MKYLKPFNEITSFEAKGWSKDDIRDIRTLLENILDEFDIPQSSVGYYGITNRLSFNKRRNKIVIKIGYGYCDEISGEKMILLNKLKSKMIYEFIPRLKIMGYQITFDQLKLNIRIEISNE